MSDSESSGGSACKYGAEDEAPHGQAPWVEHYNESVYFNFLDSRTRIGGILRAGNRPTQGYREFSVNLKLPGGSIAFRAGREPCLTNLDFSAGGLTLEAVAPTRSWRLRFRGTLSLVTVPARLAREPGLVLKSSAVEACEVELEWRAGCPMFVLNADGSGRPTPGETSLMGTDHYEQFGTVSGRISLGERSWQIAGVPSMRDHTWGPRLWGSYNGEWMCAFLPGGTGMTLYNELQPSGKRAASGAVMFQGRPHYVEDFEVLTGYDGSARHEGRFRAVVRAQGLPVLPIDGPIDHFSPLSMGTGEHRTRLASMTVALVDGWGGGAFAEFLRPLPKE